MRVLIVILLLTLIHTGARSEQSQLNPRQITEQMATQLVKDLTRIPDLNLGIELPDQLDVGLKHSRYQFDRGGSLKIKNTSPDDFTYSYHKGDHALEITQDTIGYRFEKNFNWK